MGSICSTTVTQKEIIKGPVRTRFSLDDAPDSIKKRTDLTGDLGKISLPLIGYKNIRARNIPILELLRVNNNKLLSELYEYLPQYPMRMTNLSYKVLHPKGTVLHSIEYTENKKYPFGALWKKESFGKTWTEVGNCTANYTYDPMMRHVLKRVLIKDIRIYDSQAILPMSVYVECTDTDDNLHTIYPADTLQNSNQVYLVSLNIKEKMYLDQMERRINMIFDTMRTPKENIRIKKEPDIVDHETIVLDDDSKEQSPTENHIGTTIEKPISETVEETLEGPVEKHVEKPVSETVEEPVSETVEEPVDKPVSDSVEETLEKTVENQKDDIPETTNVSVYNLMDVFEPRS